MPVLSLFIRRRGGWVQVQTARAIGPVFTETRRFDMVDRAVHVEELGHESIWIALIEDPRTGLFFTRCQNVCGDLTNSSTTLEDTDELSLVVCDS